MQFQTHLFFHGVLLQFPPRCLFQGCTHGSKRDRGDALALAALTVPGMAVTNRKRCWPGSEPPLISSLLGRVEGALIKNKPCLVLGQKTKISNRCPHHQKTTFQPIMVTLKTTVSIPQLKGKSTPSLFIQVLI